MSYRRKILKRLKHFYDDVGAAHGAYLKLDPIDIVGKALPGKQGIRYSAAISQLLREDLITGVDIGGKPAFSLNSNRIEDIRRELQWWRNPAVIVVVSTVIALAGLIWAVLTFFLKR